MQPLLHDGTPHTDLGPSCLCRPRPPPLAYSYGFIATTAALHPPATARYGPHGPAGLSPVATTLVLAAITTAAHQAIWRADI